MQQTPEITPSAETASSSLSCARSSRHRDISAGSARRYHPDATSRNGIMPKRRMSVMPPGPVPVHGTARRISFCFPEAAASSAE
jgi:hypothetical protein